jgi:hypothetical protein
MVLVDQQIVIGLRHFVAGYDLVFEKIVAGWKERVEFPELGSSEVGSCSHGFNGIKIMLPGERGVSTPCDEPSCSKLHQSERLLFM